MQNLVVGAAGGERRAVGGPVDVPRGRAVALETRHLLVARTFTIGGVPAEHLHLPVAVGHRQPRAAVRRELQVLRAGAARVFRGEDNLEGGFRQDEHLAVLPAHRDVRLRVPRRVAADGDGRRRERQGAAWSSPSAPRPTRARRRRRTRCRTGPGPRGASTPRGGKPCAPASARSPSRARGAGPRPTARTATCPRRLGPCRARRRSRGPPRRTKPCSRRRRRDDAIPPKPGVR